jgi:pre-mRNA branch site protein p14
MSRNNKFGPENLILFVKNLPYNVDDNELWDLFGGPEMVFHIRVGDSDSKKGTAYVVYYDNQDAQQFHKKLNGINYKNRYLVALFHQPEKMKTGDNPMMAANLAARQANLATMKKEYGVE